MSGFSVDTDSLGRAGRQVQKASEPLPRTAPALAAAGTALPGGAAASLLPEVGVAIDAWVTAWLRATESLASGLSISATGYAVSQQQAAQLTTRPPKLTIRPDGHPHATAHERLPGNPAQREAMDLYNNNIGRQIAAAHPGASQEELARYVREAVDQGKVVVIDKNGQLAWSNGVPVGQTGQVKDGPLPGKDPQPHGGGAKS